MNNHPGILPFKLGTAQLESNKWTFIQNFDLTPLIFKFHTIKNQTEKLSLSIKNNSEYYNQYVNSFNSLTTLEKRIENLIEQILPFKYAHKTKRGLFNPLGSFIKCITGNLDQNDAEQIDAKIKKLQDNQNKIKIDSINQITILDSTINKFKSVISNITHNESMLKSHVLKIESIIKTVEIQHTDLKQFFLIYTIINQVTSMYQSIYNILDKIEIAITFAKINLLHNSIVDPNELLTEIKNIDIHLNMNKLPLESNPQNILSFEKILVIKSFLKGFNIVFILELPLVELETYQYFNLFPLPIPDNQSFLVNIPYKPYLALNSKKYAYMDQGCIEIQPESYLCRETQTTLVEDSPPCAVQLLKHHANITSCHSFRTNLHEIQTRKIVDGKWLITIPNRVISTITCQNSVDNIPLFGSYLLESPIDCKIKIQSIILETYKQSRLSFSEVNLPVLNLNQIEEHRSIYNPPVMDLNYVNLKATKELENQLRDQKKELEQMTSTVYVDRTSFWTICLYAFIVPILIFVIYKQCIVKRSRNIKTRKSIIDSNNESNNPIFD